MSEVQRDTKIAAIQLCATSDLVKNLSNMDRLIEQAVDQGAELVFLPEAFAYLGPEREKRHLLEKIPTDNSEEKGPILSRCIAAATKNNCDLILGGFHEKSESNKKCFKTCVHISRKGLIGASYRKIHLFDISLSDGTVLNESAVTEAGEALVTAQMPFGKLGLSICYDLRFPYLYQGLVDMGAVAITVPSAFTVTTGQAHWHSLLRARAIECQSYVIAPAQYGHNWGKRYSYGHTVIIDPWGKIIAEQNDGEGVVLANIVPEKVSKVRQELPSLEHRRSLK